MRLVDVIGRPDFDAFIERVGDEFFVEVRRAYFLVPSKDKMTSMAALGTSSPQPRPATSIAFEMHSKARESNVGCD